MNVESDSLEETPQGPQGAENGDMSVEAGDSAVSAGSAGGDDESTIGLVADDSADSLDEDEKKTRWQEKRRSR